MANIFIKILNLSISAGIISLIVLCFRALIARRSHSAACLLWIIVAIRLLVPFSPHSDFSLMPTQDFIRPVNENSGNSSMIESEYGDDFADERLNGRNDAAENTQDGTGTVAGIRKDNDITDGQKSANKAANEAGNGLQGKNDEESAFLGRNSETQESNGSDNEFSAADPAADESVEINENVANKADEQGQVQEIKGLELDGSSDYYITDSVLHNKKSENTAAKTDTTDNNVQNSKVQIIETQNAEGQNIETANVNANTDVYTMLAFIWLAGLIVLFGYMIISYFRLRGILKESVKVGSVSGKDVLICDRLETPCIFGLIRPRIYIPSSLDKSQYYPVTAHERTHISRLDHVWKLFGFCLLAVYWFNPVLWFAYAVLCRDLEYACDEQTVLPMNITERKEYSAALLACSAKSGISYGFPPAFGDIAVKDRIKSVLNYKKPTLWILIAALAVCIVTGVLFMTSRNGGNGGNFGNSGNENNDPNVVAQDHDGMSDADTHTDTDQNTQNQTGVSTTDDNTQDQPGVSTAVDNVQNQSGVSTATGNSQDGPDVKDTADGQADPLSNTSYHDPLTGQEWYVYEDNRDVPWGLTYEELAAMPEEGRLPEGNFVATDVSFSMKLHAEHLGLYYDTDYDREFGSFYYFINDYLVIGDRYSSRLKPFSKPPYKLPFDSVEDYVPADYDAGFCYKYELISDGWEKYHYNTDEWMNSYRYLNEIHDYMVTDSSRLICDEGLENAYILRYDGNIGVIDTRRSLWLVRFRMDTDGHEQIESICRIMPTTVEYCTPPMYYALSRTGYLDPDGINFGRDRFCWSESVKLTDLIESAGISDPGSFSYTYEAFGMPELGRQNELGSVSRITAIDYASNDMLLQYIASWPDLELKPIAGLPDGYPPESPPDYSSIAYNPLWYAKDTPMVRPKDNNCDMLAIYPMDDPDRKEAAYEIYIYGNTVYLYAIEGTCARQNQWAHGRESFICAAKFADDFSPDYDLIRQILFRQEQYSTYSLYLDREDCERISSPGVYEKNKCYLIDLDHDGWEDKVFAAFCGLTWEEAYEMGWSSRRGNVMVEGYYSGEFIRVNDKTISVKYGDPGYKFAISDIDKDDNRYEILIDKSTNLNLSGESIFYVYNNGNLNELFREDIGEEFILWDESLKKYILNEEKIPGNGTLVCTATMLDRNVAAKCTWIVGADGSLTREDKLLYPYGWYTDSYYFRDDPDLAYLNLALPVLASEEQDPNSARTLIGGDGVTPTEVRVDIMDGIHWIHIVTKDGKLSGWIDLEDLGRYVYGPQNSGLEGLTPAEQEDMLFSNLNHAA